MNEGIARLPDLTDYYKVTADPMIRRAIRERDRKNLMAQHGEHTGAAAA